MNLWSSKILYIFLDISEVRPQRDFLEDILGLEVIENEYHPPHHRHGVVKYDAGNVILSLNVADSKFERGARDGIVTVFTVAPAREAWIYAELQIRGHAAPLEPGGIFADRDLHLYALRQKRNVSEYDREEKSIEIDQLLLAVEDLEASIAFYRDTLGLALLDATGSAATFATGNVKLVLQEWRALADHFPARRNGYLTVFHVDDIEASYRELARRGLTFQGNVGYSDIGGSVRFADPTGYVFCLYQPSAEALTWSSGGKVKEIIAFQNGITV